MSSKTALRNLIPEVQKAAIKSAMRSSGFRDGSCDEGEFRAPYNLVPRDEDGESYGGFNPVDFVVTYPGGTWYVDNYGQRVPYSQTSWADSLPPPFDAVELYNSWKTSVAELLEPWLNTPEPDDFDTPIDTIRAVALKLSAGGVVADGKGEELQLEGGNQALGSYVTYVTSELAQYNGDMIDTLSLNYTSRLSQILNGQHIVACAAGTTVAGEKEVWRRADASVLELANAAKTAFLSERGGADWKKVLGIVGTVTSALGLFLGPGGVATANATIGTVTGIIGGFLPEPPEEKETLIEGSTATEIIASLSTALSNLATTIGDVESDFLSFGIEIDGWIWDNLSYFDISRPTDFLEDDRGEYFAAGENLQVLTPHLRKIAGVVKLIGVEQRDAGNQMNDATKEVAWYRDAALGLSYRGHFAGWSVLEQSLTGLCSNSFAELTSVAERMVAASYDFDATDEAVQNALQTEIREIRDAGGVG